MITEKIHKYFASTVNLLTSHDGKGRTNVMACEWTMNVNFEPLKIMVMVNKKHLTHDYICHTHEFGVNLCADNQANLAHFVGDISGRAVKKIEDSRFSDYVYQASHIKAPMIIGCVLNAECRVERKVDMGNYTAFIGEAITAHAHPEMRPLIYHQGQYISLGEHISKN